MKDYLCCLAPLERHEVLRQIAKDTGKEMDCFALEDYRSLVLFAQQTPRLQDTAVLIMDLEDMPFSASHILAAVQQLRSRYRAEIITLLPEGDCMDALAASLRDTFRVSSIRVGLKERYTRSQLRACITGELPAVVQAQELAQRGAGIPERTEPPIWSDGRVIQIAVVGTIARCGTTTTALAACRCIQQAGGRPAVIQAAQCPVQLWRFYGGTDAAVVHVEGIDFLTKRNADRSGYHAVIKDCGVLQDAAQLRQIAIHNHLVILTMGVKPWEFLPAAQKLQGIDLSALPTDLLLLANFALAEDIQAVKETMHMEIHAAPWRPDIWMREPGGYAALLQPYLDKFLQEEEKQ